MSPAQNGPLDPQRLIQDLPGLAEESAEKKPLYRCKCEPEGACPISKTSPEGEDVIHKEWHIFEQIEIL